MALLVVAPTSVATAQQSDLMARATAADNAVLQWGDAILDSARQSPYGAPILARAYGITFTCMYDAWAAYDGVAIGTRLGGDLRRPPEERTAANKVEAVSYAAHRAGAALFSHNKPAFDALLRALGHDPQNTRPAATSPAGIGQRACDAVLSYRRQDSANQDGTRGGSPYSDWTGYQPVNEPMNLDEAFDPGTVHDPNHWQPLSYHTGQRRVTQQYLVPHWAEVTQFAPTHGNLPHPDSIKPIRYPSPEYTEQARELIELSANLTDRQKVIAEFWRLNPGTVQPPGKWLQFGKYVSRRDAHDLDTDVKMFFVLANAIMDAGIASWVEKTYYDYVRPITAIRWLFQDTTIRSWAGPGQGTREIPGSQWLPYQPLSSATPPFAEHTSGHSTFSSAGAEALRRFTGSDEFGASAVMRAGDSDTEPGLVPREDTQLTWETFTEAAVQAGMSRRYGGIHFEKADIGGRLAGRRAGAACYEAAMAYVEGRHMG